MRKLTQYTLLAQLLLLVSCIASRDAGGEGHAPSVEVPPTDGGEIEPRIQMGAAALDDGGEGWFAYGSAHLKVTLRPSPTGISLRVKERNPRTGSWHTWTANTPVAFDVEAFCARHANEFYVYGQASTGAKVLERWSLEVDTGSFYTEKVAVDSALGIAVLPSKTELKMERPFVEPSLRASPSMSRATLAAPAGWGTVIDMAIDPEGRFLLALAENAAGEVVLHQYHLPTSTSTEIYSSATVPELQTAREAMFFDSSEEGRVATVKTDSLHCLFFLDAGNDGVFESVIDLGMNDDIVKFPYYTRTWHP